LYKDIKKYPSDSKSSLLDYSILKLLLYKVACTKSFRCVNTLKLSNRLIFTCKLNMFISIIFSINFRIR